MAPNFSGDRDTDHMGIAVLNAIAFKVCSHCLRPGGTLLMKTLHGALEGEFFVRSLKN
jgi:23S rRNA methylase